MCQVQYKNWRLRFPSQTIWEARLLDNNSSGEIFWLQIIIIIKCFINPQQCFKSVWNPYKDVICGTTWSSLLVSWSSILIFIFIFFFYNDLEMWSMWSYNVGLNCWLPNISNCREWRWANFSLQVSENILISIFLLIMLPYINHS